MAEHDATPVPTTQTRTGCSQRPHPVLLCTQTWWLCHLRLRHRVTSYSDVKPLVSHSEARPPGVHTWTRCHCSPPLSPCLPDPPHPGQMPSGPGPLRARSPPLSARLHGTSRQACPRPDCTGSKPPSGQEPSQAQTSSRSNAARSPSLLPTGGPVQGGRTLSSNYMSWKEIPV